MDGGGIVAEALNSGLPMLVFDAPPGNERRISELIENKWQTGFWVKRPADLAARINHLLRETEELERLRSNAGCQHQLKREPFSPVEWDPVWAMRAQ